MASTMIETVFVQLLDEGVEVRRPVQAVNISEGVYSLLAPDNYDPELEVWEFLPGTKVKCVRLERSKNSIWVAIEQVMD